MGPEAVKDQHSDEDPASSAGAEAAAASDQDAPSFDQSHEKVGDFVETSESARVPIRGVFKTVIERRTQKASRGITDPELVAKIRARQEREFLAAASDR